jgi:hypothetical protein
VVLIYYFELKKAAFWFMDFQQPSLGGIQKPLESLFTLFRAVSVALNRSARIRRIGTKNLRLAGL